MSHVSHALHIEIINLLASKHACNLLASKHALMCVHNGSSIFFFFKD